MQSDLRQDLIQHTAYSAVQKT